jgi:hypothetical protein
MEAIVIKTETVEIDGRTFIHTRSDANVYIKFGENELYEEAYDLADLPRTYTETDIAIEDGRDPTDDELAQAARIMLGLETEADE